MFIYLVLWWICLQLAAPTWCFVLLGIGATFRVLASLFNSLLSLAYKGNKK